MSSTWLKAVRIWPFGRNEDAALIGFQPAESAGAVDLDDLRAGPGRSRRRATRPRGAGRRAGGAEQAIRTRRTATSVRGKPQKTLPGRADGHRRWTMAAGRSRTVCATAGRHCRPIPRSLHPRSLPFAESLLAIHHFSFPSRTRTLSTRTRRRQLVAAADFHAAGQPAGRPRHDNRRNRSRTGRRARRRNISSASRRPSAGSK